MKVIKILLITIVAVAAMPAFAAGDDSTKTGATAVPCNANTDGKNKGDGSVSGGQSQGPKGANGADGQPVVQPKGP